MPVSRRGWLWVAGCFACWVFRDVLTILLDNFLCVGVSCHFSGPFVLWGNFTNVPSPVSRSVPMGNGVGRWVATTTIPSRCGAVATGNGTVSVGGFGLWVVCCGWCVVGGVLMFVVCCRLCVPTNFVNSSFFCRWQIDHHLSWRSWQHVFLKFCRGHQWKI